MSTSLTGTSTSKALNYAISHGYQIAPDALRLLQKVEKKEQRHSGVELDSIVRLVIEAKVRGLINQPMDNQSSNTIQVSDLVAIDPDTFTELQIEETNATSMAKNTDQKSKVKLGDGLEARIEVISDPSGKIRPVGIEGFSQLFKSRYEKLMRILGERPEARHLSKISQLKRDGSGRVGGLVYSKKGMKNGVEVVVEDETGRVSIFASSEEAKKSVSQVSLDQCVISEIEGKGGRFLMKSLIQPDLPNRVVSPSKKTVYALFLSDLHVGSRKFLEGAFDRFVEWLSGVGVLAAQDSEIIRRLKYLIIAGDIVDGVGIFPNQEYELVESNVHKQYEMVSRKLASIPEYLSVLVIPGNHDSTRQALPQPMIPRKYAQSLYNLKNMTMLGDPALIRIHGVSVLIYHGRSLDDVLATTPGLSYERPTEAMKVLLKARHLAPMFGSRTPIAPEIEDYLVIDSVPDIFHAGHVHSVGVENYKGTLMINSGAWQAQTGYQANLGIMPRPGLVPIVNLANFEVITREFLTTFGETMLSQKA
jgi:DNA polymerase II small subunit